MYSRSFIASKKGSQLRGMYNTVLPEFSIDFLLTVGCNWKVNDHWVIVGSCGVSHEVLNKGWLAIQADDSQH